MVLVNYIDVLSLGVSEMIFFAFFLKTSNKPYITPQYSFLIQNIQKKSFLTPLGFVRQYNSPKPYCSRSIIIQGNFHLSKHPNEWFDRFFTRTKRENIEKDFFIHGLIV